MRRIAMVGLAACMFFGRGSAAAKMPYYSIELPAQIGVGQTVQVTVRLFDDQQHTQVAAGFNVPRLDGTIRLFPLDPAGRRIESEQIRVTVRRVSAGVYRGWLMLPDARTWLLCGVRCDGPAPPGYPTSRTISPTEVVVASAGPSTSDRWSWTGVLIAVAAAALLVSLAVAVRRRSLLPS